MGNAEENAPSSPPAPPPSPPPEQPANASSTPPPPPTPTEHPVDAPPLILASPTKDPAIVPSLASSPTHPLLNASSTTTKTNKPNASSVSTQQTTTKESRPSTPSSSSSYQIPSTPPQPPVPYPPPPPLMMPPPPFYQPPDCNYQHKPYPYFPPFPHTYPIPGYNTIMYSENVLQNFQQSWSTGLFDCFSDLKNCFITLFCPCFTFGQITEIVNEGQTPWWEGSLLYKVLFFSTLSGGIFLYACYYRFKMRKKYLLKGNWMTDFLITSLCHHCALCQGYRQLDRLGFDVALGWEKNKERERRKAMETLYQVPPMVERGMFR